MTRKFAVVFGDHRHDCASFDLRAVDGDFSAQFADLGDGDYVWNIASYPPTMDPPPGFDVRESQNSVYMLLESAADGEIAALEEFEAIKDHFDAVAIRRSQTFRKAPAFPNVRKLAADIVARLRGATA